MIREIRHFHIFGALGGGAKGFNRGNARVGSVHAKFRCIGSIDVDAAACRDFDRHVGVKSTRMDLFDRSQYLDWHGHEPPAGWREATVDDIRCAAGGERPHIVFLSAPCKGFSGLLNETRSRSSKYQALNRLTLRGIWLMLEAWKDDPPELIVFENVPRIATRGRHLLDQIGELLRHYGYAVAETTHDCGELGALAQSRKRFLLVARHIEKVPPFLYEPRVRPLRGVGTVLDRCPLPGDMERAGPMHRIPNLQWKTWVRLAFVEAGSDWRSLQKLRVDDGVLSDYLIAPDTAWRGGGRGVRRWEDNVGVIAGENSPSNGAFSVADPRFDQSARWHDGQQYGVHRWQDPTGAIVGQQNPGQGRFAVADPRPPSGPLFGKYKVTRWGDATGTVIGGDDQGAYAVADPRPAIDRSAGHYLTGGHFGVLPYAAPSYAVTGSACHDNGHWSVADPRMPAPADKVTAIIRALDGTWHRPFTTFELACLQSYVDPEEHLELDGMSDQAWRERIGNMVPPAAAEAIASVMGHTLLLAWSGETFVLDATPIWVRPMVAALSLAGAAASTQQGTIQ